MHSRPYARIGEEVGAPENDVIERIARLKEANVIRQISAIFDTRRLGYKTTLVAFRCPEKTIDKAAQRINLHPGVSHNYERNGYFNLWFTIAVPPNEDIESVVNAMASDVGALSARLMPTIRFFKIGVNFDMVKEEGAAYEYFSPDGYGRVGSAVHKKPELNNAWNRPESLSDRDIDFIRNLQEDLPVVPEPFNEMAERLRVSVNDIFAWCEQAVERQIMRRFSAVLHHRRAGFRANAMAVWNVPEDQAVEIGLKMAESPWVSHCYQRPTFPDWKYTHFTMIHATNEQTCEEVAAEISRYTGVDDYLLLYSSREYKKTRVRYFVENEYPRL